jgi:hypothetical protein
MKSLKVSTLAIVSAFLLLPGLHAQSSGRHNYSAVSLGKNQSRMPHAFEGFRIPPSAGLRFLASDEGRAFLKAAGHPVAQPAIAAFGEPSKTTVVPAQWFLQATPGRENSVAAPVPCAGGSGAQFNLEPRANAVPQNEATADFLPDRTGAGNDLIVQTANDWRGNLVSDSHWDQSLSGYYVHRSSTADCSTQFEGGLPSFTFQGNIEMGIGSTVVAADPARDAFFVADTRFANTGGVGLFRVSASALLNPTTCPNGTHSQAQATSCWMATPPALLFPAPSFDSVGDQPEIAVDERATNAGTGAGDVYVVLTAFDFKAQTNSIFLAACTNALNCGTGKGKAVGGSDMTAGRPYVRVRPDGRITVSYVNSNSDGSLDIKFVTCTPSGAPKEPVCSAPALVQRVAQPIVPSFNVLADMMNINLIAFTFPKHANRAEAGGKFTNFVVYDDCKNPFVQGNPPFTVCLNAEVVMTSSGDNGKSWSTPVSVDTATGHHFYPAITTDPTTGIVNIAYYSTEGDRFNHEVRVFRNQINPGGTSMGTRQAVTKILDPIDGDPDSLGALQTDAYMGAVARGTTLSGESRLYISFDSTAVMGTYEGRSVPELNNSIIQVSF